MAQFGVRVNGSPRWVGSNVQLPAGTLTAPGVSVGRPGLGFYQPSANTIAFANDAATNNPPISFSQGIGLSSGSQLVWTATNSTANGQTVIQQIAANRLQIFDGTTTAGTIRQGIPEFSQTASTFAQTATITNGPRAANPVTWLEVTFNNGASSGRIPIW